MRTGLPACTFILLAQVLAGCADGPRAKEEPPSAMSADVLTRLAMHRVQDVYGVMGTPNGIDKAADGTDYVWRVSAKSLTYVPNSSSPTSGFIGSPTPSTDTSPGAVIEHDVICQLRISADPTDRIRHLDFKGPRSACGAVSKRLADWIEATS